MYSGGFGYFKLALPALGQASSYFAMENAHWLLVGLDTAYVDHDMDTQQVAWLNLVIEEVKNANGGTGEETGAVLAPAAVLAARQPGTEAAESAAAPARDAGDHRRGTGATSTSASSRSAPALGLFGRCLGHGGIPEVRKREVEEAPTEKTVAARHVEAHGGDQDSPGASDSRRPES